MDELKINMTPDQALLQKKLGELKSTVVANKSDGSLKETSEEFEALFVYFMLRNMRKTVVKSGLLESGLGGDVMESLFDQELSRTIAQNSRLGIAEIVQQQLGGPENAPDESLPLKFEVLPKRQIPNAAATFSYLTNQVRHKLAPFENYITREARRHNLDANLIRAIIMAESSGNPNAVSSKGAKGLMQLMDETAKNLGVENPFNPDENIRGGAAYLVQLLRRFNGDVPLALAGYNAGPAAVAKYQDIPPYKETREYVNRTLSYFQQLKKK